MRYGDLEFIKEPVGNFYGNLDLPSLEESINPEGFFDLLFNKAKLQTGLETPVDTKRHISAVSSRDIKLNHLYSVVQRKKSHKAQLDLSAEITRRMQVDHIFEDFQRSAATQAVNGPVRPRNFDCLKALVSTYDKSCGKMDDYSLQFVRNFVVACESGQPTEELVTVIRNSCSH